MIDSSKAHTIVVGNEKGGSGKTTTTMHLVVSLLRMGFSVGSVDLDGRQKSLTRYVRNRERINAAKGMGLAMPAHHVIEPSAETDPTTAFEDERARCVTVVDGLRAAHDFVVLDSPGYDAPLSRVGHSYADTLITPLNDSLMDLDLLAEVDGGALNPEQPGVYARMVWQQRQERLSRRGAGLDWIVMRNRMSPLRNRNQVIVTDLLKTLSGELGFRVAEGFLERLIYRQLFLVGLTILDLRDEPLKVTLSKSHKGAVDEVRSLLKSLWLPTIDERLDRL